MTKFNMTAVMMSMQLQATAMAQKRGINPRDMLQYWRAQVIRARIPCRGTVEFERHRTGEVVSLGELMRALGKQFTAKQLYVFTAHSASWL